MPASGIEPPVSEAELHGFVDGGLDRGRREAVQAFLAASPADAARVETWREQNDKIRAAFASVETLPPPRPSPHAPGAGAAAGRDPRGSGQSDVRARTPMWRERWFAQLIGLAFASGVVLTAGVAYLAGRVDLPQDLPLSSSGPVVGAGETFAAQAMAALQAFGQPSAAPGLPPKENRASARCGGTATCRIFRSLMV